MINWIRDTVKVRKISVPSLTPMHSKIVTQIAVHNVTAILSPQTIYLASIRMTLVPGHDDQISTVPLRDSLIICSQLYFFLKGTPKLQILAISLGTITPIQKERSINKFHIFQKIQMAKLYFFSINCQYIVNLGIYLSFYRLC